MKNLEVIRILSNIADLLELQDVPFKPKAYRQAARSIEALEEDIEEVWKRGELTELQGIGESIAEKIEEILRTGKLSYYEQLKKDSNIEYEQLRQIPSLGPKKIKILYEKLNIKNIADLEKALQEQKIRELSGFGEETEKNLLQGLQLLKARPHRFLYVQVAPIVADLKKRLAALPFVQQVEIAGSFHRGKETIGDVDILVISSQPKKVTEAFVSLPDVKKILAQGPTRSSLLLATNLQVDLRVMSEKEGGSALLYFTGSKEHNIELRKIALKQGTTLNEYGLFTLKGKKWLAGRTETEIYQKLGLSYIQPELRENRGEIAAAQNRKMPQLLTTKDIPGVFHNHSTWSDGNNSLLEMAQEAEKIGFKYISFNDHYGHIGITNPLNEKRLEKYPQEIEKVRKKVGLRIFTGVEIDILKDGTLPLSKKKLRELDVVIASVHIALKMSTAEMTKRVCTALENNPVNILGHPTDRLLNVREPLPLQLDTVFSVAKKRNTFLEINSSPTRMDLSGEHIKSALEQGCQFALSTDAHTLQQLHHYPLGVMMARRGWVEKKDLLNCWNLPKMEKALEK